MFRRTLLAAGVAGVTAGLAAPGVLRAAGKGTLKIGYQKSSTALVLLKKRGWFESELAPLGFDVSWAEFPSGPPILEAMNANAVNLAFTGETPPVFAQAAGTPLVYVANSVPHPHSEAILVPAGSSISTVAALKGKQVAVAKGSSAHYLLVSALLKAGLSLHDITPVYLPPPDARAAFQSGDVAAWAIWDPFYEAAQQGGAKAIAEAAGIVPNHDFYLARKDFADANPDVLNAAIAKVQQIETWVPNNRAAAATEMAPSIGLPQPLLLASFNRQTYGVSKISPAVLKDQQKVADTFYKIGLIPAPVDVSTAAWT